MYEGGNTDIGSLENHEEKPLRYKVSDIQNVDIKVSSFKIHGKPKVQINMLTSSYVSFCVEFKMMVSVEDDKELEFKKNVFRRYKEFKQIYQYWRSLITKKGEKDVLPTFPKKSFFKSFDVKVNENRLKAFDKILKEAVIVKNQSILRHVSFWDFLEFRQTRPTDLSWKRPPGKWKGLMEFSPSQVGEIEFEPHGLWESAEGEGEGKRSELGSESDDTEEDSATSSEEEENENKPDERNEEVNVQPDTEKKIEKIKQEEEKVEIKVEEESEEKIKKMEEKQVVNVDEGDESNVTENRDQDLEEIFSI